MATSRGIGRGLASILPEARDGGPELREVAVELISPNPDQPRRRFDDDSLAALAESIGERGVVQPLVVRPVPGGTFELVAGERRWRAAARAGLETVPAVVQESDELHRLETALIENMAREDLNPVEEARAVAALIEDLGVTREAVARRVGRSRTALSNLVRLLDLPDEALDLVEQGTLSEGHGRAILQARDPAARRRLAREAARRGWSVRETERRARAGSARRRRERPAPDAELEAARTAVEDDLGSALGAEVRVRVDGRSAVAEVRCASLEELAAVAARAARDGA